MAAPLRDKGIKERVGGEEGRRHRSALSVADWEGLEGSVFLLTCKDKYPLLPQKIFGISVDLISSFSFHLSSLIILPSYTLSTISQFTFERFLNLLQPPAWNPAFI